MWYLECKNKHIPERINNEGTLMKVIVDKMPKEVKYCPHSYATMGMVYGEYRPVMGCRMNGGGICHKEYSGECPFFIDYYDFLKIPDERFNQPILDGTIIGEVRSDENHS